MKLLIGKTALITGASRGIGEAIAMKFANEGCSVAFSYLSSEEEDKRAAAVVKNIESKGVKGKAYPSNAASFEEVSKLIEDVLSEFEEVHILVNNAGITQDNLLMRMDEAQWDTVIGVNLKSVFNMTKHIIPHFMKRRSGSIINITSIVGITGNAGQSNYASSKSGMIGFTKSIAKEIASRNIRSNAIAPGFIETDMTQKLDEKVKEQYMSNIPLRRYGSTEEVANVALFLASDLSSYVNGQVIAVDGGLT